MKNAIQYRLVTEKAELCPLYPLFIEFIPTQAEWFTLKRQRRFFASLTLAVVIFGIALSTDHQSGVGALFLMAKSKIHPLWYSEFIPILFFLSSIPAGLSVVVVVESISQRVFKESKSLLHKSSHVNIILSIERRLSFFLSNWF